MMADKELIDHYRKLVEEWREDVAEFEAGHREVFTISNGQRVNTSKEEIEDLTHKIQHLNKRIAAFDTRGT